ncbi:MAG TPA: VanW family protein [Acidimicrobiales bacterium]|nr:VanW family protein [Acidimicrobiales bacterium]
MDEQITESAAADAPAVPEATRRPAHLASPAAPPPEERRRRRPRWVLPVLITPVVLFLLAVVAWTVDTSSSRVPRNVTLAGHDVSGLSESALLSRVAEVADELAATRIELVSGGATYDATAADLGLRLDEDRSARNALEVDDDTATLLRPVAWMRSFFDQREASLAFLVNDEQVTSATQELEGDARTAPTEPSFEVVDGEISVVEGVDGRGIDPAEVAALLPDAAAHAGPGQQIRIEVPQTAIAPLVSDDAAREAAAEAEDLTNEPVEVQTAGGSATIDGAEVRRWVRLTSQPDGTAELVLDEAAAAPALRAAFADIDGAPKDARITLDGGRPVIIPDQPGLVCCGEGAAARILAALRAGEHTVSLDLVQGPATFTTADAEAYKIVGPVGGNNAWRNGAPTTAGPGFTTYHGATGARIINIHRIADLVRGVVIPPGGSFSVNEFVGKRTEAKGFVAAGAISNGEHVDEIGGGISQFATTTFNAAYFAGLDIDEYQAHSEYFDRYPLGREATMGYPKPDLRFTNNTPYGILIWTSYTQTSLTVTLYSTPYATAEQTDISESTSGRCRVVVTTRTRTYPDGHSENDQFRARYRPGPGESC